MIRIENKIRNLLPGKGYFCKAFQMIVLIVLMIATMTSFASQTTQVGRYLVLSNKPLPEQKNLMLQTVQVHFPSDVKTLGDAIQYLLRPSGYTLVSIEHLPPQVKKMFGFSLPLVDRDFGPMSLQEALQTLVGGPFELKVNRLNRQISFHLHRSHEGRNS